MKSSQNIVALVYDFDGTLSPDNMQETTIFKAYGLDKDKFWAKSQQLSKEKGYERTLAYLKLLIHDPVFQKKPFTRQKLKELSCELRYFDGVEDYFDRLNQFVSSIPEANSLGVQVEHYVVSSGIKEILEDSSIYKHFKKVYACEFDYENDKPIFPKLVINDTNKTQFLFRINKGKLDLSEDINSHMKDNERRVPFKNMIYIGDGHTDIPSMTVTQKSGGHAIAVYPPGSPVPLEIKAMVAEGRADHFAPADYTEESLLMKIIKTAVRKIVQNIAYETSSGKSKDWVEKNK